ncbi:hypothetical protein PG997_011447 [Apiospora hydei]|uniref:Uncharacterized protein n=1 Tax=Apiospora hydei TaxID=1337664 RepID=A0ABR1VJ42_9PEZI
MASPPVCTQPTPMHTLRAAKTFEVTLEDSPACRIVVNDVLLPTSRELKHSTEGDCRCKESDEEIVNAWMFWHVDNCLTHSLISRQRANALLNLTRKDLDMSAEWVDYFGDLDREMTKEHEEEEAEYTMEKAVADLESAGMDDGDQDEEVWRGRL